MLEHMIEQRSSFVGSMQISISMSVIMMTILSRWARLRYNTFFFSVRGFDFSFNAIDEELYSNR